LAKVTSLKVITPLYMRLPKKISVNLNWYRNAHYRDLAKAKKLFSRQMIEQLRGVEIQTPVEVTYQVFKPRNSALDKMNVASVTSKFLLDALTEYGVWTDDNDNYVKTEKILPTVLDRENPRVEVCFKTISS
jgi:Holliday junction resolvase RusA-like endonuclease